MKNLLCSFAICIVSLTSYGQANPEISTYGFATGNIIAVGQTTSMSFKFGQNGNIPIAANTAEWTLTIPSNVTVVGAATVMPAPFYEFSRTITATATIIVIRNNPAVPATSSSAPQDSYKLFYTLMGAVVATQPLIGTDSILAGNTSGNGFLGDDMVSGEIIVVNGVTISGNVWNDLNANAIKDGTTPAETNVNGTGTGTGADIVVGVPLYVNLADENGYILASVPVKADGTYTIPSVLPDATGLQLQVSTTKGIIGDPLPDATTPAGWINTGVNAGAGNTAGAGCAPGGGAAN